VTQSIQAYFRTENEAEDVKILLQRYEINNLETGRTGQDQDGNGLFVPLAAGIATNGTGTSGAGTAAAVNDNNAGAALFGFSALNDEVDDSDNMDYVLSVQVNDEDYEEIVHLIRSNNGHIGRRGPE